MTHGYKIDNGVQLDLIQYALKANVSIQNYFTHSNVHGRSNLQNNLEHSL